MIRGRGGYFVCDKPSSGTGQARDVICLPAAGQSRPLSELRNGPRIHAARFSSRTRPRRLSALSQPAARNGAAKRACAPRIARESAGRAALRKLETSQAAGIPAGFICWKLAGSFHDCGARTASEGELQRESNGRRPFAAYRLLRPTGPELLSTNVRAAACCQSAAPELMRRRG